MNILLIEDNLTIIKGLKYAFDKNNYNLISITSFKESINYLKENNNIDLIILDIMLKDGDGITLFNSVIKKLNIPTIFLTVKDDENTIVECLNSGAEDYITKPFSTKELLARINKILLRFKNKSIISVKDIKYDMDKMVVYKNNKVIELTSLELKILNLLFVNYGKLVTRNSILEYIWQWTGNYVDDHTVTVYFNRIREKLGKDLIVTVKGLGYRIDEK